jgi:hypothetical protein
MELLSSKYYNKYIYQMHHIRTSQAYFHTELTIYPSSHSTDSIKGESYEKQNPAGIFHLFPRSGPALHHRFFRFGALWELHFRHVSVRPSRAFLTLIDLQLPGSRAERRRSQSLFLSCSSGKSSLNFNMCSVILVLPIKATIMVNIPEGAVQWGTLNGAMKH